MDEIIGLPDEKLRYVSHEIDGNTIIIHVESTGKQAYCPYCGTMSDKVHSKYTRKLQDLPIQGKKVKLLIKKRKFFCINAECSHKTFAEPFEFFEGKASRTKRLQEEILRVALTQSSVSASKYLRSSVADVGKSTICTMLKKEREKH